jgi:hypothetical protein
MSRSHRELAVQLVTANLDYRTEHEGDEEMLLVMLDLAREVEDEGLCEEVLREVVQFVGSFCMLNAGLRGDCTPIEYWRNIAAGWATERPED